MSDSPSAPPAPDYTGAANATAAGNLAAAQQAQQANMVNQTTPYGSLNYTEDPTSRFSSGNPSYSSSIDLSPTGQTLLDQQDATSIGLGNLTGTALDRVAQSQSTPFDYGSVGDVEDQAYNDQTARLDPQWAQATTSQDSTLANQGILPGSEAYTNSMRDFNAAKNDAYTSARTAALNTAPQTLQLATALRNQPLNELNALRTGSQVTNPTFGTTPQQQTTTGANLLGAAQAQGSYDQGIYGSNVASANSNNSTTGAVAGAAIGAVALF